MQYDVFLSHNDADEAAVETLAQRVIEEAGLNPFLDRWHLIPGKPWQEGIEAALGDSAAVAVFIGPSGVSPWHNEQLRAALDRAVSTRDEYRVIPVLLPDASEEAVSGLLARRVWVDFRAGLDDAEAFDRLVSGIKGEAVVSGVYTLPDEPAPYRGLLRFEADQARFFFGREVACRRLVEKLSQHTFVALVGASGSGKSSLVRAGLIPELADDALPGSREWLNVTFTPGSHPLRSQAESLVTFVPPADRLRVADDLTERMSEREDGLHTTVTTLLADRPQPLLLVIDQFEEVFTLCQDGAERCRIQAEPFVANLVDAVARGDGRVRVLITLRADFLDRCLAFPALKDLLEDRQVLLGPLDEPALREVIVRPAQEVGAFFEKGLVNAILRDVEAGPGVLPLLQHALYELWRARRGPWLTLEAYEESGGVRGALQRRAQATYEALTPVQQAIARNILVRLTTLGEGVSDTRRRVARTELYLFTVDPDQVDIVLQALSGPQARLVVADEQTVEVTHEALIQQWDRLRNWLEADREALAVYRHITQAAQDWESAGRDHGLLYRGVRLTQASEWADEHAHELNALEYEFLEASRAAQRRSTRLRVGAFTVIVMLVFAVLTVFAVSRDRLATEQQRAAQTAASLAAEAQTAATAEAVARRTAEADANARATAEAEALAREAEAERQANIAISGRLATQSQTDVGEFADQNYELGLLLAIESGRFAQIAQTELFEADSALRKSILRLGRVRVKLPYDADVNDATWNQDESLIVTSGDDHTARMWDPQTGEERLRLVHDDAVNRATWNQNGSLILTSSDDRTARVWDALTGEEQLRLTHDDPVYLAKWNRDESLIMTVSGRNTVWVWDARIGERRFHLTHDDRVLQAEWNQDESLILTRSADNTVRVWDAESGEERVRLEHDNAVNQATWNRDESLILTCSDDETARVWDTQTGEERLRLTHDGVVRQATWSQDESMILTASWRGVLVWDARTGEERFRLKNDPSVWQAEWNHDESLILTTSWDGTARVWDAQTGEEKIRMNHGNAYVWRAAWNQDESVILTQSGDNTIRVWDAQTGEEKIRMVHSHSVGQAAWNGDESLILTTSGNSARLWDAQSSAERDRLTHDAPVNHIAWNRDGGLLLTTSGNTVRVWNAETSKEKLRLTHDGVVRQAIWNQDGSLILTSSDDGTARVWEVQAGKERVRLVHDGRVWQAVWNQDESLILTGSDDGTVRVWDAGSGKERFRLVHDDGVNQALWNPDESLILTASGDTAWVWDAETGAERLRLAHDAGVNQALWNPNGNLILTTSGDTARVWDADTGAERFRLTHSDGVRQAAWNRDGSQILTCICNFSDENVWVWDAQTGTELFRLPHDVPVDQAVWSQDGSLILTATGGISANGTAQVWDGQTGEERYRLTHDDSVYEVVWNHDGSQFLTRSGSDTVRVWNTQTGAERFRLSLDARIDQVMWNPDETLLAILSDRSVLQYYLRMEDLLTVACERVSRNMTHAEWRQFLGDQEYRATCPNLPPSFEGGQLARTGQIDQALLAYQEYQSALEALDPNLEISAGAWNALCWFGSLWGRAPDVADACERAVALDPDAADIRDSRGLNRALRGDYAGAIEDFEYYVAVTSDPQREEWISELKKDRNPFDENTLDALR